VLFLIYNILTYKKKIKNLMMFSKDRLAQRVGSSGKAFGLGGVFIKFKV
jgi:hypothetical protein